MNLLEYQQYPLSLALSRKGRGNASRENRSKQRV
jgi:hypothetical protein